MSDRRMTRSMAALNKALAAPDNVPASRNWTDRRQSLRIVLRLTAPKEPQVTQSEPGSSSTDTQAQVSPLADADADTQTAEPPQKKRKHPSDSAEQQAPSQSKRAKKAKVEEDDDFKPESFGEYRRQVTETRVTRRRSYKSYHVEEETTETVTQVTVITRIDETDKASGPFTTLSLPSDLLMNFEDRSEILAAFSPVRLNMPKGWWDVQVGSIKMKFGKSPYSDFLRPTPEECQEVLDLLVPDLFKHDNTIIELSQLPDGPMHAPLEASLTVDSFCRTIGAQSTTNYLALRVQNILCQTFKYTVDGKEVVGKIPNYHTIMQLTEDQLAAILKPGGLQHRKAKAMLCVLRSIYEINVQRHESLDGIEMGQKPNAPDFVPGLLCLDFLQEMTMVEQATWMVTLHGIGVKTCVCILEFNLKYKLCAVDAHILNMALWLGWLPKGVTDADKAFNHLDGRIPDNVKHAIHQAFWHHAQKCKPCKSKAGEAKIQAEITAADAEVCVLEDRVKRFRVPKKSGKNADTPKPKKVKVPKKGPVDYLPWKKFKTAEEAAAKGYEMDTFELDDDFMGGSSNIKTEQQWILTTKKISISEHFKQITKKK